MKLVGVGLVTMMLPVLVQAQPMSGTYTVKKDGSGNFASVYAAVTALRNRGLGGDVLFSIYSGTYSEGILWLLNIPGSATYRTTFQAAAGESVIIDLDEGAQVFYGNNSNNVKIRNLTILAWGGYGVFMVNCDNWRIDGCIIRAPQGVWMGANCDYDSVTGNDIRVTSQHGIYSYNTANSQGLYIANNMVAGWTYAGIFLFGHYNTELYYNTVIGQGSYALYDQYGYNEKWRNNIFTATTFAVTRFHGSAWPDSSDNNCFRLNNAPGNTVMLASESLGNMTLAQWRSTSANRMDMNSMDTFPNAGGVPNPRLRSGSPCIGAGRPVAGITADVDGDPRSPTSPCIGADEFTTVSAPMSGTYTVRALPDTTGDYASVDDAYADVAVRGAAGDVTFDVHQGTFRGCLNLAGLQNGAFYLTCRAASSAGRPDTVVLNPVRAPNAVYLFANDRLRFEGLTVKGYSGYAFCLDGISNGGGRGTDSVTIRGCRLDTLSGIVIGNYAMDDSVVNTSIRCTGLYGIYVNAGAAGPARRLVVANCYIVGWTNVGVHLLYHADTRLYFNTIVSNATGSNCVFDNNGTGAVVRNNILYNTRATSFAVGYWRVNGSYTPANWNNNCHYVPNNTSGYVAYNSGYCTWATWRSAGFDAAGINANPLVTGASDPHLLSGSPCIGTASTLPGLTSDIDGHPRDAAPDIGCDEYYFDVATLAVLAPTGTITNGAVVTPAAALRHSGGTTATYYVKMVIDRGGSVVYQDSVQRTTNPGDSVIVSFASWVASPTGSNYRATCYHKMVDGAPANDTARSGFAVGSIDVGVTAITAPVGSIDTGTVVVPTATVANHGDFAASFRVFFSIHDSTAVVYYESTDVTGLGNGTSTPVTFAELPRPHLAGPYVTRCSTWLASDANATNDTLSSSFRFTAAPPGPGGWRERSSMPAPPANKPVRDGGWLVFNPTNGLIYAAKGGKMLDFYRYNPANDTWQALWPLPLGREMKGPSKGAAACSDGAGFIYMTKGNSTQGFYRYSTDRDSWTQLADVPLGTTNKRVKGGTDLAWYDGSVYLLKGIKNEFWRYDVSKDSWYALADLPAPKWDKGSWLVLGPEPVLYAHQAKYHGFFAYDLASGEWSAPLGGMPFIGMMGKSKKSKDGGSAALLGNTIYALKGGNTQEFWRYDLARDSWAERETVPQFGTTMKRKRVKNGADITATEDELYALKGNKTLELWQYVPWTLYALRPTPDAGTGIMAGVMRDAPGVLRVLPSPLRAGFATVRFGTRSIDPLVPRSLSVFDASGRCALRQAFSVGRLASGVTLDLRSLPAGVYLLRLDAVGAEAGTRLLVVR